ncbi:putative amino acid transporter [Naematelia encephala]|uniref:Putative amino acid transporter n=1 Tax=Naematelia encephala TaxID=71784 RepID=A0A1Y2BB87_9TREE|nr:putative amino acid transporter [Naematelia encephala]
MVLKHTGPGQLEEPETASDPLANVDSEKDITYATEIELPIPREDETHRSLKSRQMSMIAIGGAIGTGLILSSGTSLARSGPGSIFLAYVIMGIVCSGVMTALGEMSTLFPTKKGFAGHASRCVDQAFGATTSLVYLCKYLILSPNQIVAFSLIIRFWNTTINGGVWATILILFVIAINLLGIKWIGEVEFWFSFVKIVALTGLILLCLIIDLGGVKSQPRIGFAYWKDGKAFKTYKVDGDLGRFLAFANALVLALFSYMGCEIVGVTIGEAKNPRKTVPGAIRKTFFRVAFFYVFSILIVGMAVDSTSPLLAAAVKAGTGAGAASSPFVVAIVAAKIKIVPAIANSALLVFAISAANSDQYIASRTLYGMARDGNAPKYFTRCTSRGVPWAAYTFTMPFMLLSYLVTNSSSLTIFNYFASAVTIFGGLTWICILSTHVAFMRAMKAQNMPRETLPYRSSLQPYLTYFSLFFTCVVCFFKGFDAFMPFDYKSFITNYVGIPVFVFGYAYFKFAHRTVSPTPAQVDLATGAREFDDVTDEEEIKFGSWRERIVHGVKNW